MELIYKSVAEASNDETFQPYIVNGYMVDNPLTSAGGGNCKWGFCKKNDKEYFLKEFLSPKFPSWSADISKQMRDIQIKECNEWLERRTRVYTAVKDSDRGNIVVPLELFREHNQFYLVTEKIESNSVDFEYISKMPIEEKVILLKILAYQFAALAENHVVHSDLKPDNLIFKNTVADSFTVKIIDFDASFLEDDLPDPEEIVGDSVYYSPEAIYYQVTEGEGKITSKSDLFSLGIIFHQILCGELPSFESDDAETIGEAVLNDLTININENVPKGYDELIKKMLIGDVEKRISAKEVWDEIFRINGEQPKKMMKNVSTVMPKKAKKADEEIKVKVVTNNIPLERASEIKMDMPLEEADNKPDSPSTPWKQPPSL